MVPGSGDTPEVADGVDEGVSVGSFVEAAEATERVENVAERERSSVVPDREADDLTPASDAIPAEHPTGADVYSDEITDVLMAESLERWEPLFSPGQAPTHDGIAIRILDPAVRDSNSVAERFLLSAIRDVGDEELEALVLSRSWSAVRSQIERLLGDQTSFLHAYVPTMQPQNGPSRFILIAEQGVVYVDIWSQDGLVVDLEWQVEDSEG